MLQSNEPGLPGGRRSLLRLLSTPLVWWSGGWPAEASAAEKYTARDLQRLETRMAAWLKALKDKDTRAFLSFYSKTGHSRYVSTLTGKTSADLIEYARLEADLAGKTGWFEVFFDAGGDDVFRDHVLADGGRAWRRRGLTFKPPDDDTAGSVYVRWRKDKGSWVVDTVAEPSS